MALFTPEKHKTPLGIYVHVPFCKSKCGYCDFYSLAAKDSKLCDGYLSAVCAHIRETGPLAPDHQVDTIYIGGGTPSHFGAEGLATILAAIRKSFDVASNAEITVECNPESVTDELMKRLRAEGVNRISLGIQCDRNDILKAIGRPHTYEQAMGAFQRMRKLGFSNISVDLMYGLPGQNLKNWMETVQNVLRLKPDHVSCYGLKLEEGTPMYEQRSRLKLPDDDAQADMYLLAVELLSQHGYRQYEISNFAKPGFSSRHNLKYWTGGEYIGFGPDASSDFAGKRYSVVRNLSGYIRGIQHSGHILRELTEIPVRERAGEYLMLRLRTSGGIQREEYESRYLLSFDPLETILITARANGQAQQEHGRWRLTPKGMLLSNTILTDLLIAQETSQRIIRS